MTETFSKLLPSVVLAALLALPTVAKAADPDKMPRHISVSASATVNAEPDIAMISTGVVSEADTAREALTQNTAAMKRLIDGLKGAGIDAKDIQTVSFNVEPRYEPSGSYEPKKRRSPGIIGYRVTNQVRIAARQIA